MKKIVCISAANIEPARKTSASIQTCQLIADLLKADGVQTEVEIVSLLDYKMQSCFMCGDCLKAQRCQHDEDFNHLLEKMVGADGLFFVVPHYAPFPSKMMILLEKLEEMGFLGYSNDEKHYRSDWGGKPTGLIGHGGQVTSTETLNYYKKQLVEPLAMALMGGGMKIIGAGEDSPYGVSFGIRSITKPQDSIFVDIQQDWDDVRQRIAPLVKNVAAALA